MKPVEGQLFLIGTDPGTIKWSQITTPHFKVIYPINLEVKGQYVANALEYNYLPGGASLKTFAQKTPVIIHPFTTIPTSDTYIAPRRSDFFTTPPQDIYPQDWTDQLIIHEFRHAVQYSAVNKGFSKGLYYILGENGTLAVFGLFVPLWLMEGDATVAETALHFTGRGRTPSFEMKLRAQFVERGMFSYDKACNGSFRDFVPNKYEIGYQLAGWSRVYFGKDLWAGVFNNIARRPYTLAPLSVSLRRETGLNKYQLYDTITSRMSRTWRSEDKNTTLSKFFPVSNQKRKFYSNYTLPTMPNNSQVIAVKSSPDFLTRIISIDGNGNEHNLLRVGANYYSESLSSNDSVIFWSELVNDPRWVLRDYRVIKKYNLNSGKVIQLTHKTKYFAPSISHDCKHLAVVEADPQNIYSLVIINSSNGSIEKKFTNTDNLLYIHPSWSKDDSLIVSVVFGKGGNSIGITDFNTGNLEILLPYSFMELKRPSLYKHFVIYTASYNGKDNIYALNRENDQIFRVTDSRFGASDAFVSENENMIVYSDYTYSGYNIVKMPIDTAGWEKISLPSHSSAVLAEKLSGQETFIFNSDSVPKLPYPVRSYSKLLNKINLHSWAPVGLDIQNFSAAPGITLFSQNLLGTTVTMAGFLYNRNEKTSKVFINLSDEGRFIAFDLNTDFGNRIDTGIYLQNETIPEKWQEFNITPGLRLPLSWTSGPWIRKLQAGINADFKFLKMDRDIQTRFEDNFIVAPGYMLLLSNELKTSYRDIYPGWKQEITVNYSHTPFGKNNNSILAAQMMLGIPGLFAHHSLQLYAGFQKKSAETYPFQDYLVFPRGYSEIKRREISCFSAMYTMPVFYPDWSIKYFAYLKRLKASFFYDLATSHDNLKPDHFSSAGIDLTFDLNLFSLIVPLETGLRSAYLIETSKPYFGILFSLNFGGMY